MQTYQLWYLVCKNNVTSVIVSNVTAVANVTPAPKVLKMTKNHSSVPKRAKKLFGVLGVVYQPVYQTSHVIKCTKCTKTHQGWCVVCKNNVTSVTVPNVTGVKNVTPARHTYRKWPKIILVCQKCAKKLLGVPIGVVYQPVYQMSYVTKCTKCTKTHQGWCLVSQVCKTNVTSVTVPNVTGVQNLTTATSEPKMTNKNLSCRREAARCFVLVCSQLQHTYSAVFTARCYA